VAGQVRREGRRGARGGPPAGATRRRARGAASKSWKVFQGIQTGADAYTKRIEKRLTASDRAALAAAGARYGQPILELPPGAEVSEPWRSHPQLIVRSPEPRAILYGALDDADYTNLVILRIEPPEPVVAKLEKWRPLLATRAEIKRNPRRKWWEAAWPRNAGDMASPKVIALYRTDRGRFAVDETGKWQPSIKATLAVGRSTDAPVAYLCGLLNSELLDLWYAVRGKQPRDIWRNYEPKRMNEMPYRPPGGDRRADRLASLVREIASNRRALLPHRAAFPELERLVKDPWKTGPVELDDRALIAELPANQKVSIRLDARLDLELRERARARVVRTEQTRLSLERGKRDIGRISGGVDTLDLLEQVLSGSADGNVGETLLPNDLVAFRTLADERRGAVADLLADGRRLVEEVERLVCALYDVPDELTEDVIAHAVTRAASADD
jgi:hypothetical protein